MEKSDSGEAKGKVEEKVADEPDCYVEILALSGHVDGLDNVPCMKSWTVADLKAKVQNITTIPIAEQRIILKAKDGKEKGIACHDDLRLGSLLVEAGEPESMRLQLVMNFKVGGTSGVFYGSIF